MMTFDRFGQTGNNFLFKGDYVILFSKYSYKSVRWIKMKSYKELKNRQRQERESHDEFLGTRIHRALSWLNRAEQCSDDADGQVIFLWIAFNAAYANYIDPRYRPREHEFIFHFLDRLCQLDKDGSLENLVWELFPRNIRILLDNKYVFQPYWDFLNDKRSEDEWKSLFSKAKSAATAALGKKKTAEVLALALSRVYTLRNQLIHGGATWNSSVNRDQVRDCARLMSGLIPMVIEIMMDSSDVLWGQPCYPVVS